MRINLLIILLLLFLVIPLASLAQVDPPSNQNRSRLQQKRDSEERLASQYYRNKEYEKAAEIYARLYNKKPTQYYYTYYYYCLIQLTDYESAEKLAKKQIRKNPEMLKYYVDLGYVYYRNGKEAQAKRAFEEAIQKLPPNVHQVKDLANAFYNRAQMDYAVKTYKKGRKLLENEYTFRFELGNLFKLNGNYKGMIDEYLEELGEKPESIDRIQSRLQAVLSEGLDEDLSQYLWNALLRKTQKYSNNIEYSEMLLWLSVQQKDFSFALVQAKSLDKRMEGGGEYVFDLARVCVSNASYNEAIEAYEYIINKGEENAFYLSSLIGLLNARYLKITSDLSHNENDLRALEKDYIKAIETFGYYPETLPLMKELAHLQAFYLDKQDEAIQILDTALMIPNSPKKLIADCKIELADILLFTGEVWESTLLYSQVEKTFKHEPTGHLAKFKNAKLTYYIGEFEWAKAQLDILKAATSKLIANDAMRLSMLISDNLDIDSTTHGLRLFAKADLLSYQNKDDIAMQTLDSIFLIDLHHPLFDEILFKKAEIKIKYELFMEADSLLARLVQFYPYDILADDALFLRAQIQEEEIGNQDIAMELYQKLLLNYPGSLYTVEARKRFRRLRGDDI